MMKKMYVVLMVVLAVGFAQAELLVNGDFEGGATASYNVPASWHANWASVTHVRSIVPSGGVGGGAYLAMREYYSYTYHYTTSSSVFFPQYDASIDQSGIAVTPGQELTFSVWAKSPDAKQVNVLANWDVGTDTWLYGGSAGTDWAKYDLGTLIVPAGASTLMFKLQTDAEVGTEIHYDNASVIPEPVTMSLLGLGALMLRKRKK